MLQLFIDIKLKFTKLETEAVQPTENDDDDDVAVAIAVAVVVASANFSYRAYLVVGTIIKSHFDHKIVHCVNPLHVATLSL